ncbi:MAG TPA: PPC domain-containing protein, partial [Pyrinomonadaceae bacterium]
MNRPPGPSHAVVLALSLVISGLAVAGPGPAARAQAAPQKPAAARGTRLGPAGVKSGGGRPAARRAGQSPPKPSSELSGEQAALRACVETATGVPAAVNSALTADDCAMGDGTRYDVYSFSGAAGQQVSVTLTSSDFDAYLYLFYEIDEQNLILPGEDDDGGGGSDARIPSGGGLATLPYAGTYYVVASALAPNDTLGNYTLTLA